MSHVWLTTQNQVKAASTGKPFALESESRYHIVSRLCEESRRL